MPRGLIAIILAITFTLPGVALATAQIPDRIRIDGVEHSLNTNPLESHLASVGWKPPKEAVVSSANWRGYTASWEIAGEQFVLSDVVIRVAGGKPGEYVSKSILTELFPSTSMPVVASWYSGALIVPEGEMTRYVHMGYGSSYERYRVLRIAAGRVVEHQALSADAFEQYKAEKFNAFTRTVEFKEALATLRKQADGLSERQLMDFMMSFYAERYLSL